MKLLRLFIVMLGVICGVWLRAEPEGAPGKAADELKRLVSRQRELLAQASSKDSAEEMEDLRPQFQELLFNYDDFLKKYPNLAAGYVSYAMLLNQPVVGEGKLAAIMLLKANELDPNLPIVKNQLGNYLAEEGKPIDALNYYLAAVKLAPEVPLYHYQVGSLLYEGREDFLKSGAWTREALDEGMQDAFLQAASLAPDNMGYAYRYGESFYDLERPEWSAALAFWRELEKKAASALEQQTIRLHQANVLIQQRKFAEAREVLAAVNERALQMQKEKLVAQLPKDVEK